MAEFSQDEQAMFAVLGAEVRARGCTPLCMVMRANGEASCGTFEVMPGTDGGSMHALSLRPDGQLFDWCTPVLRLAT